MNFIKFDKIGIMLSEGAKLDPSLMSNIISQIIDINNDDETAKQSRDNISDAFIFAATINPNTAGSIIGSDSSQISSEAIGYLLVDLIETNNLASDNGIYYADGKLIEDLLKSATKSNSKATAKVLNAASTGPYGTLIINELNKIVDPESTGNVSSSEGKEFIKSLGSEMPVDIWLKSVFNSLHGNTESSVIRSWMLNFSLPKAVKTLMM